MGLAQAAVALLVAGLHPAEVAASMVVEVVVVQLPVGHSKMQATQPICRSQEVLVEARKGLNHSLVLPSVAQGEPWMVAEALEKYPTSAPLSSYADAYCQDPVVGAAVQLAVKASAARPAAAAPAAVGLEGAHEAAQR